MKTICFYLGYSTSPFTGIDYQKTTVGGTEIATIALAENLAKLNYNVYIFCISSQPNKDIVHNNVHYINISHMQNFLNTLNVNYFIICRYLHCVIDYTIKADKLFIWLHDACVNFWHNGGPIVHKGFCMVNNIYDIAMKSGADGGKISGAGGGGFFIFYCNNNHEKVRKSMKKIGLRELQYGFDFEGTKIITNFLTRG